MTKAEKADIQTAIDRLKGNKDIDCIDLKVVLMAAETLIDTQPTMGEFQVSLRDRLSCHHNFSDRTIPATCIHCGARK